MSVFQVILISYLHYSSELSTGSVQVTTYMHSLCGNTLFCFQVKFYYFEARLIFDTASIEDPLPQYTIDNSILSTGFKKAIRDDYSYINRVYLGSKLKTHLDYEDWKYDGVFVRLRHYQDTYIYRHSRHAACSNVKFSQLFNLLKIQFINND